MTDDVAACLLDVEINKWLQALSPYLLYKVIVKVLITFCAAPKWPKKHWHEH